MCEEERQVHHPISLKRNKESKICFTKKTKEGQNSFSLCRDEEEEAYKEGREHKVKMEREIRISEAMKREASNRTNESEPRNPSPSFSRSYSDRFIFPSMIKSHEESTCEPRG